jgi:hypothetical protein
VNRFDYGISKPLARGQRWKIGHWSFKGLTLGTHSRVLQNEPEEDLEELAMAFAAQWRRSQVTNAQTILCRGSTTPYSTNHALERAASEAAVEQTRVSGDGQTKAASELCAKKS